MSGRHRACPICGGHLGVETHYSSGGLEVAQTEHCSNGDCPFGDREQPPWHGRYQAQDQAAARVQETMQQRGLN